MPKEIVAKILVDYQRYQTLLKAAAAPSVPPPSDSQTDATLEAPEEKPIRQTPEGEAQENSASTEEQSAAEDVDIRDPANESALEAKLEDMVQRAPSAIKERAEACVRALLSLKKIHFKDGCLSRGRRKIVAISELEAVYKDPFNAHDELELITRIKTRAKLFNYKPSLPTTWFRL